MKDSEAVKCIALVTAAWPWPELSDASLKIRATMLSDLEFPDCKAAIERLICTVARQPSIAEIRAEFASSQLSLPDPAIAWGEVNKAIGKFGRGRVPEFSCPEIAAAVDVIGWQTICNDENVMSTRSRFVDAYRAFHSGASKADQLGPHASRALPRDRGVPKRLGEFIKVEVDETEGGS